MPCTKREYGQTTSRRQFLATASAGGRRILSLSLCGNRTEVPVIVSHWYRRVPIRGRPTSGLNFPRSISGKRRITWRSTRRGHLYVIHEGHVDKPDHPSIFVFDSEGKYVRSFGNQFQGGGHGIEVREENGQEFLYRVRLSTSEIVCEDGPQGGKSCGRSGLPWKLGCMPKAKATKPEKNMGVRSLHANELCLSTRR